MKSVICAISMMSLIVLAAVAGRSSGAVADDPVPIGKIMSVLHKGKKAPIGVLKTQLKSQAPDWVTVQKEAKTYAKYAADMPRNDPPKGDAASWKKLSTTYATNAKDLSAAAQKEDLSGANSAFRKIGTSCKACHDQHKED